MPYSLSVEKRSNYLFITVTGDNAINTVRDYLAEVRHLCQQHDTPNVLIVENLEGPSLDIFSMYNVISQGSEQALPVVGKIAYVDINPAHKVEDLEFAEDVAVNRGLIVKVCPTIRAAEEWIEKKGADES
jgi:hypothetical protein